MTMRSHIPRPSPWLAQKTNCAECGRKRSSGNPPVGAEVEALMQGIGSTTYFWQRAKVAHEAIPESSREILVFSLETTRPAWVDEFRPIRTADQVAAEEREKAIEEMIRTTSDGITCMDRYDAEQLYKAGYRKQ